MEASATQTRPPGLPALTGLRFLAAFHVLLYHSSRALLPAGALRDAVSAGPVAVSLFFLLSGLVLTYSGTTPAGEPTAPPARFLAARFARIYPLYALALLLDAPFVLVTLSRAHPARGPFLAAALGAVPALLLLQAWSPLTALGWNSPGWSLSCEGFFYAAWPRVVRALRPAGRGAFWARCALLWCAAMAPPLAWLALRARLPEAGTVPSLLGPLSLDQAIAQALRYTPLLRLPEFLIGICLGHALRRPARSVSPAVATLRELSALGCAAVAVVWLGSDRSDPVLLDTAACTPLFAVLLFFLARGGGVVSRALGHRWVVALGNASYALYILEEPVGSAVSAVLKRLGAGLDLQAAAVVAGTLLAALAAHRLVELPLCAFILRRRSRPPALAASGMS